MSQPPEVDMVTFSEAAAPKAEVLKRTVRSHHVRFLGWAMGYGDLAADSPKAFVASWTPRVITWLNSRDPEARRYAETTVLVDGQDTSEQYSNNLASGLKEVIDAPDDEEFTIVEELPDSIVCEKMHKCGLADHCTRRYATMLIGDQIVLGESYEQSDTNMFLAAAAALGISVEIIPAMSQYIDSPQIEVRTLTLKAGVIRQIIQFMAKSEDFSSFFDDEFKDWDKMRS